MALAAALLGFALSSVVADVRNAFNRTATGGVAPLAQATSPSPAASAVATKVDVGVVDINTRLGYQEAEAAGTGMVITANGEVLTNNHVVDGATSITATIVTTGRTYTAKVLGTDPSEDVALIQLEGASGLKTVPLGDSSKVKAGQSVVAIGNAGGVGGAPSVVTGSVLATGESITATDDNGGNPEQLSNLIRTNAPLQPGDSGGPLADPSAKVIGMDTAASSTGRFRFRQTGSNESFAIPINQALGIAKQIESGKSTSNVHIGLPGFLGIEVVDAGQGRSGGASIAAVVPGAPAERAGLAAGDVIQSVDGQAVTSAQQLTSTLQAHHAGDRVTIAWSDSQGRSHHATVTLTTGPAD